jgi:hypothetical protein
VQRQSTAGAAQRQWHSHTAVLWHEGPPLGHSSPGVQEAALSPQLTEQPAQLPRGREGGALQELLCPSRSVPGGPAAAVLGGPLSLEGAACGRFSFATHAASDSAMSTPAASDAPDRMLEGRVLTSKY